MKKDDSFEKDFVITEKIYNGFIELFNDKNPLHTNSEFAKSKGFDSEVMHGNILGGFLSYFVGEMPEEKNVIIHNQQINFHNPVYLNDELKFRATVTDFFESVNAFEIKFTFHNQKQQKVSSGKIQVGLI